MPIKQTNHVALSGSFLISGGFFLPNVASSRQDDVTAARDLTLALIYQLNVNHDVTHAALFAEMRKIYGGVFAYCHLKPLKTKKTPKYELSFVSCT